MNTNKNRNMKKNKNKTYKKNRTNKTRKRCGGMGDTNQRAYEYATQFLY